MWLDVNEVYLSGWLLSRWQVQLLEVANRQPASEVLADADAGFCLLPVFDRRSERAERAVQFSKLLRRVIGIQVYHYAIQERSLAYGGEKLDSARVIRTTGDDEL